MVPLLKRLPGIVQSGHQPDFLGRDSVSFLDLSGETFARHAHSQSSLRDRLLAKQLHIIHGDGKNTKAGVVPHLNGPL